MPIGLHPLLLIALVAALAWATKPLWEDAWTPWRALRRRQEIAKLRRTLDYNPADRDARFRLASELVACGEHAEASVLVERNIADGDDDATTLALAGVAAFGTTEPEACARGRDRLERARGSATKVQIAEIDLALACGWMRHARWQEAREPLLRYIDARPGSIEALARMARIHDELGERDAAAKSRAEAWTRWRAKPRFQRAAEKRWAWRVRPAAGAMQLGITAVPMAAATWFVVNATPVDDGEYVDAYVDEYDALEAVPARVYGETAIVSEYADRELHLWPTREWSVPQTSPTPTPDRFEPRTSRRETGPPTMFRARHDLDEDGFLDLRRKAVAADFVCRVPPSLGAPLPGEDAWIVRDTVTDAEIYVSVHALQVLYLVSAVDAATGERSAYAFEQMIEDQPRRDCVIALDRWPGGEIGVEAGAPFASPLTPEARAMIDDD